MTDVFGTDAEEMRRVGYRIVDAVVDHVSGIDAIPALRVGDPDTLADLLGRGEPPIAGSSIDVAIEVVVREVMSTMQHGDHPRYFARVPGPSSFTGIAGDWLATGFNAIASSWGGGAGPSAVELVVLDWLRQWMGLPDGTEGIMLSGGSIANLTALSVARDAVGPGVVYFSDQTHSCVPKALRMLRVPSDHQHLIDTGTKLRLTADALVGAIAADRTAGRVPSVVVATAGSTNTGAVDELTAIAEIAADEGMWLHVDGAYGGPTRLTETGAAALAGIELADSLVIDPHKWLFQPYDVACLLVRRPGALASSFTLNPEYLADVVADEVGEIDLRNRGPELTRRARAIKLWLTIVTHGTDAIAHLVQRGIDLAEHAEGLLRGDPSWIVVTEAELGIVTFVRRGVDDEGHVRAARSVTDGGFAAVTCTKLNARQVLRLCTINPRTTESDVAATLAALAAACDV